MGAATGSLGQGLSVGVGMALNGKYLEKSDYRVYVLMGDGEIAEGSVWEAAALATHYRLENLVGIIDVNGLGKANGRCTTTIRPSIIIASRPLVGTRDR